jgi:methionine-rich copper-binding protein CopC
MKSKYLFIVTSVVGLLVALTVVSDLATKSITVVNPEAQDAMQAAEEELGLDSGDTLTKPARALRVAREAQSQIMEQQQRQKEMLKEVQETQRQYLIEMGADSASLDASGY